MEKNGGFVQFSSLGENMERYFNNEPDDENEGEGEGQEMEQFVKASKQDIMDVMHLELVEKELNQKLLEQAQQIASQDFWWVFRNSITKVKTIDKIYKKLKKITSEDE